jgi:uncharacterized protein YkwD
MPFRVPSLQDWAFCWLKIRAVIDELRPHEPRELHATRRSRTALQSRVSRTALESLQSREPRESAESQTSPESRDARPQIEIRDRRESKQQHEAMQQRESQEHSETRAPREPLPQPEPRQPRFALPSSAGELDAAAVRLFTICFLIAVLFSSPNAIVRAIPQGANAERELFEYANHERVAQGLQPLRWDSALATAARDHAAQMAQRNTLSHQFSGEPPLQDRARLAGARFSQIAENVAEGPSAEGIHQGWMHSPPHRANLLDPELTAIGIAVVATTSRGGYGGSGGTLFAVQDFSQSVASLSFTEQEQQVASALAARGLQVTNLGGIGASAIRVPSNTAIVNNGTPVSASGSTAIGGIEDARRTCGMERGWSGPRPGLVARYESGDLSRLPPNVEKKIEAGRFRAASVGACEASGGSNGFVVFRVAVLFY